MLRLKSIYQEYKRLVRVGRYEIVYLFLLPEIFPKIYKSYILLECILYVKQDNILFVQVSLTNLKDKMAFAKLVFCSFRPPSQATSSKDRGPVCQGKRECYIILPSNLRGKKMSFGNLRFLLFECQAPLSFDNKKLPWL